MTVLLKLYDELDKRINSQDANSDYEKGILIGLNVAANIVSSYLPAERQQIRDTWKAAVNWYKDDYEEEPGLDTYIKNLNH